VAIERGERREGGIVKSERHSDAENGPGGEEQNGAGRPGEHDEAGCQHDVRQHQNAASALPIDDPADRRTGESCDQQSGREGCEDPRAGHADRVTDRAGKNGRQIIA
jgi:hypothetical protein